MRTQKRVHCRVAMLQFNAPKMLHFGAPFDFTGIIRHHPFIALHSRVWSHRRNHEVTGIRQLGRPPKNLQLPLIQITMRYGHATISDNKDKTEIYIMYLCLVLVCVLCFQVFVQ